MADWYKSDIDHVVNSLSTSLKKGLSDEEAKKRLQQYGLNELVEKGTKNPWLILWDQIKEVMVIILLVAAAVSAALGEFNDVIVIMAIVVLNAILGFTQEYRAEQAIAALKKLSVPTVRVRRNDHIEEISARELVPGDIVLLEAGNLIPADGRLLESINLKVQEAALTGESEPVEKSINAITGKDLTLGDHKNMVFMGTVATYGRGTAVITETGMSTELGNIADLLQTVEREQTPLQRRLEQLGKGLAMAAVAIVAVVFLLGILRGESIELMALTAISMAVAAVPEGLPAVVTIGLALGSQRMLKRNALIRKLPAVETLGSVTVICSDKTGTLTENRMTVTFIDVAGELQDIETLMDKAGIIYNAELEPDHTPAQRSISLLVKAGALCNDAILQTDEEGIERAIGDPTEGALVVAAARLGHNKETLDERWPRVAEIPFTSERKRMTTIHKVNVEVNESHAPWRDAPYVAFSKGAVDSLLQVSDQVWLGDNTIPLNDEMRERILAANARLAQDGQRVLGVAFRPLQTVELRQNESESEKEDHKIFIGLVAMIDPPRPEVKEAVTVARTAGIRPIMITGDHPLTAQYIAKELTIADTEKNLTGQALTQMSVQELENIVDDVSVYARVSPEHKLNIVEALQRKGEIVAMTGDGVNDAPALKRADIGVAMGITGTDVSKEAADMVLLDDNFATIVAAVKEGRVIYDNIRKFIKYTMTSNSGEIWVMLIAPFLGMPLPLLPLQILWINLVTDGLPGLALTIEPAERGTMRRPPHHPQENIFGRGMWQHIIWVGLLMGFVTLAIGLWTWNAGRTEWQTIVFTTLTLSQMGHALAIRSGKDSLFTIGLRSNLPLLGAVLLTFVMQLAVIYLPFLQDMFSTVSLSARDLGISLLLSTVVFWGVELEKWFKRRNDNN